MGYHTEFNGQFRISPPLKPEHEIYLKKFSESRRMKRDSLTVLALPDPVRDAVGLEAGEDWQYFVGAETYGYDDKTIKYINKPPAGQPGLWCQWVPTSPTTLEWDEGEKFYRYIEWLKYLIDHFLVRWGYELNGTVRWYGEDADDRGEIEAVNNHLFISEARIEYVEVERWSPALPRPSGEI